MYQREDVLRQAMALPAEDRAYVVTVLTHSLTGAAEDSAREAEMPSDGLSGEAFMAELERRSDAYRAGSTTARPIADVLADQYARQTGERSA